MHACNKWWGSSREKGHFCCQHISISPVSLNKNKDVGLMLIFQFILPQLWVTEQGLLRNTCVCPVVKNLRLTNMTEWRIEEWVIKYLTHYLRKSRGWCEASLRHTRLASLLATTYFLPALAAPRVDSAACTLGSSVHVPVKAKVTSWYIILVSPNHCINSVKWFKWHG